MHKSLSVSRQGTFDTGPAHLDKRGSIRRGDVELPVVDDSSRSRLHSRDQANNNNNNNNNDSGFSSQSSPSSKGTPPSTDQSPASSKDTPSSTDQGPPGSRESEGKGAATRELSARYVDHNKLFPEPQPRVKTKTHSEDEESDHAASYRGRRKKSSPRSTEQVTGSTVKAREKEQKGGDQKRVREKNAALVNGQGPNKEQNGPKLTESSSKSTHAQNSLPGPSPESQKGKSVQAAKSTAKEGEKPSSRDKEHHQHNTASSSKEPRSPRNQAKKETQHHHQEHRNQKHPQQQQPPQHHHHQKQQTPRGTVKEDSKTKGTSQTPDKAVPPSLDLIKKKQQQQSQNPQQQQQQQQSVPTTEAKTQEKEQQQNQQRQQQNPAAEGEEKPQHLEGRSDSAVKTSPVSKPSPPSQSTDTDSAAKTSPASKPSPSPQSTDTDSAVKTSPASKPSPPTQSTDTTTSTNPVSTPLLQPSPVLLSTQQGSSPPQDHTHKAANPSSQKIDTPRNSKGSTKGNPQPATKTGNSKDNKKSAKETPKSQQKSAGKSSEVPAAEAGSSEGDGGQCEGQAAMTTMAARQPKDGGGLDSLAQVTSERDQLLRNEKTYQQRILQLEEEVKSVVRQSQQLSDENRLLSNKLEAYETKVYGGSLELKDLRREKQDLVTLVAKTTSEKQDMDAENERLKSKLAEADSKSRQWDALYVENNKLKTKQAELERRIVEMENEKLKLKNSVRTAESSQMDKLAAVQNENKKLQADLINQQTKTTTMERKVERLESENKELIERLDQKKTELDELMRAMKTDNNLEIQLKEANQELEFAKNKLEDYKKDLNEANHRYEVLEKEKDSVKNALRLKESECKGLKATSEEQVTQLGELKRQVDTAKRNVKRLEDDLEDTKQVEKDVVNMKARVRSLKNEIEDSLSANHKMKQERTEARLEAERLNRELAATSEAMSEARRYIKKLEGERGSRDKVEEELRARKQREQDLERQAYELNTRNEQLRTTVRALEGEKEELLKRDVNETHAANRRLQEENRKLRQMMVERNMEIAQRHSERHTLLDRVDNLERKQNDSDIKVRQLRGWVEDVYVHSPPPPAQHPTLALPPVPSKGAARQTKPKDGAGQRRKKGHHLPQQQRQHQLNRSWEDLHRLRPAEPDGSIRTTPGLPGGDDTKGLLLTSLQPASSSTGYFDMYKNKMKLIRGKKW